MAAESILAELKNKSINASVKAGALNKTQNKQKRKKRRDCETEHRGNRKEARL